MRSLLLIVLSASFAGQGFCQLVNGSFETNTGMPSSLGQWALATGWNNAGSTSSTPDYFHMGGNVIADLPETPTAIVTPFDGDAIMGLAVCSKSGANKREYISTPFDTPLTVGEEYHLNFRLTNGSHTASSLAGLSVDHLGILFSTTPQLHSGDSPIVCVPHFTIDTVFFSDKWQKVTFTFTADQPYEYLTFGLFNDDAQHTIIRAAGQNPQVAYYFVDDFALTTEPVIEEPVVTNPLPSYIDPSNSAFYIPNAFTPNNDGDNDIFIPIAGFITDWSLEIYTKWGDPVFLSKNAQNGWDGSCMGNPCANGSYIWKITYNVPDKQGEERTVIEYGFVNLVK